MKRCPQCRREYPDDTLNFCLEDGDKLVYEAASAEDMRTAVLIPRVTEEDAPTRRMARPEQPNASPGLSDAKRNYMIASLVGVLLIGFGIGGYFFYTRGVAKQISSIAVMPFVNEGGSADIEYLSDGLTETLIGSLSQLPNLNVKASSSIFRYKGKDVDTGRVARDLNVQALVNGRVVQRGQELILYVELVDAQTENSLWKQTYRKSMADLVTLQTDVARDVAQNLKVKLSGADERRLVKNYTDNNEAYQLYLKGRFHMRRSMRGETQTAISYFQQAIGHDPNYALAYAGLADAYRSLGLGGELPALEVSPKAKQAALRAVELDDGLAESHRVLGSMLFFFDWNWSGAESEFKRALELDPKNADAHRDYAYLLSDLGRGDEALAEVKRAQELDPLNLRTNAQASQFMEDRPDDALKQLQTTIELDPDYWLPHLFASGVYIDKGMYPEAEAAARRAMSLTDASTHPTAYLVYALAKGGKQAEARRELERLLNLESTRYVSPYSVALAYQGLGETDKAFEYLERGFRERVILMIFLKTEPKWRSVANDPRYKDLLRRMNLPNE
jgi:TolB-like protein/Tfp pilus assembly protein PilF